VDSTGQTIDFLLTAKREAGAAKRFFRKALRSPGNPMPRAINVDKNPAYPAAVATERRRCSHVSQQCSGTGSSDGKKRTRSAKAYGSFSTAWRTLQEIEAVNMIREGRVRWVAKLDAIAQAAFIAELFGIAV
jgi:transposase, IS6 family